MFDVAAFFVYITIMAYTPGPNNLMSMGNAGRFGFRKSLPFNFGMWAGFSAVMTLCMVFTATLYAIIPRITLALKLVGAAYMLYLAWTTARPSKGHGAEKEGRPSFASGAFLQFVNPKIYVYGFTAFSSWIAPAFSNPAILVAFALFLAFFGFLATLAWAAFGKVFARLFGGNSRALNVVLAILLVYCAISLFR